MKMMIPFGDWSEDGHCQCKELLVEAPSMENLYKTQQKIKTKYGEDFYWNFATEYEEPKVSDKVWQALRDTDWKPQDIYKYSEWCDNLDDMTLEDYKEKYENYLPLEAIESMFIHLLNAFGGQIKVLAKIPQINNWTCRGFETVGYGCFE